MAKLELDGICKGYDRPIIDRMSLTVEEGEFFVIVGPSGSARPRAALRRRAGCWTPAACSSAADVTVCRPTGAMRR
jgi:ABC-type nitrate/sulfonate/bicarbonate transport system ATPase subunit